STSSRLKSSVRPSGRAMRSASLFTGAPSRLLRQGTPTRSVGVPSWALDDESRESRVRLGAGGWAEVERLGHAEAAGDELGEERVAERRQRAGLADVGFHPVIQRANLTLERLDRFGRRYDDGKVAEV